VSVVLQDTAAERALIGLVLTTPDTRWRADVTLDDFTDARLRTIWRAIDACFLDETPIDLVTVADRVARLPDPDATVSRTLVADCALEPGVGPEAMARILRECTLRRAIARAGRALIQAATEPIDPMLAATEAFDTVRTAAQPTAVARPLPVAALERVRVLQQKSGPEGLTTGFAALDNVIGGLPYGELTVLGARPGMGKSALAQQIALQVARQGKRVLLCTPEMSEASVTDRMLSQQSGIPLAQIRKGGYDMVTVADLLDTAKALPDGLRIFDAGAQTTVDIIALARREAMQGVLDLVIVDHLQYLADQPARKNESTTDLVGTMCKRLKQCARSLRCVMLVVSQLSRESERRTDKRPVLADLRASGDIEQDADIVTFLYRPGYYDDTLPEGVKNVTECLIAKNRNGPVGKRELVWEPGNVRFWDREWKTETPQ